MDNEYENRSWYDEVRVTQRGLSLPAEQCSAVLSGLCNYDYEYVCAHLFFCCLLCHKYFDLGGARETCPCSQIL